GSMAHATEDCAQSAPVAMTEVRDWHGCVQTVAKAKNDSSSSDQQLPASLHGCHGHHSGVPADVAATPAKRAQGMLHVQAPSAALPPAAFTGTFRPPIA